LAEAQSATQGAPSEEDVRRILAAYEQYQAEAEAITQQLNLFHVSIEGCDKALSTIKAMESADEDQDLLVPIGQGSFVHAKLVSKDKVIVGVGGDVSIEKSSEEAKKSLDTRRSQLAEASKKLNETLNNVTQEIAKIEAIISRYEQEAAARGGKVVQ